MVRHHKLSVILPAYNESQHIVTNLREVVVTLENLGYHFEVILVDDGSPDNTYLHAARVLLDHPERVRIVRYDNNEGKGNALICGSQFVTGDIVVFLDADMDLHPEQLPMFFEMLEANDADAVIGSKRHPLSNVSYPRIRRVYSAVYYALIKTMFGLPLRDTQTGIKVFRTRLIRDIVPRLLAKRFAFDIELLANAHRRGFKVIDAPVTLEFQRKYARIKIADIVHIFKDTLAIFYRMHILRYYDRATPARDIKTPAREILRDHVPALLLETPNDPSII